MATRTYRGTGTLEAGGLRGQTRYTVTRTLSSAGVGVVRNIKGLSPMKGGDFEDVEIELRDVIGQIAQVLATAKSATLTLEGGSRLPISSMGSGWAVLAGNAEWHEDEEYEEQNG